jgi:hypothetical protein
VSFQIPVSLHPIVRDPPFVLLLFWLAAAIGRRALRTAQPLAFARALPLERGVICCAIGLGLLQYVPFSLGVNHVLTPRALWIAVIALLALFAFDMALVARSVGRTLHRRLASRPVRSVGWRWAVVAALSLPLSLEFVKALTPPTDPDGIGYHLPAAARWLRAGSLAYMPTFTHTNAPMGVDMLYTLAVGIWSDTAAKLIHFGFGALALLAIFALGRRLRDANAGCAAAALWLVGPHKESTLQQFSWAYVELASTLYVVCMALAWLLWRRERAPIWLASAALCTGFAMTTKLTNAPALLALLLLLVGTLVERRSDGRRAAAITAASVLLALLPLLPWLLHTWRNTGNPVYPMLSSVFPSRDWSPEAGRAFGLYFKYYNWGETLGSRLDLARRIALCWIASGALLLAMAAIARRRSTAELQLLGLAACVLALCAVQTTGLYLRFFLPVFALAYVWLCAAVPRPMWRSAWLRGALLLFLLYRATGALAGNAATIRADLGAATGYVRRDNYLRLRLPGLYDLWEFANWRTEPSAQMLVGPMSSYAHGATYYCERTCYVTDAYLQARIRMDTWDNFLADVRRDRIGYLVAQRPFDYAHAGPDYAPARNEQPFVRRLAMEHGSPLFASGEFTLYRLDIR